MSLIYSGSVAPTIHMVGVYYIGSTTPSTHLVGVEYGGSVSLVTHLVGVMYDGTTAPTEHILGKYWIDSIAPITHDVIFSESYSGSLCTVVNNVTQAYSGSITKIGQKVRDLNPDFLTRNGWDFDIYIGTMEITHSMIHGDIIVNKTDNINNTCEFDIFVDDPVTLIDYIYDGQQQVVITYNTIAGINRLVTTIVDSPQIDLINKTVKVKCSNQRVELVNANMQTMVKDIGRYSIPVHGTFNSVNDELNLRLKTVPMSVDFDSYNIVNLNSWFAKVTPDFTLNASNVYRKTPSITWQNRGDVVNSVQIILHYKHTRLYHWQREYSWEALFFGDPTNYAYNQYSSPPLNMIQTAISGASWKLVDTISSTATYILVAPWFGGLYAATPIPVRDTSGNIVNDASGNPLYTAGGGNLTATPLPNVMQASWNAAIRFSQYLDEQYTLTVNAPQSITQNGTVVSYQNVSYEDAYDATAWEAFASPTSQTTNYFDIGEITPGTLSTAINTCLDMANTTILNTHRGNIIVVQTQLMPTLELSHTVELDLPLIACKGRVTKIQHTLDTIDGLATTELTIALFRAQGSTGVTPRIAPSRPSFTPSIDNSTITFGNHYNIVPVAGTYTDSWNGFIGSTVTHYTSGGSDYSVPGTFRPQFTDIFRVDTPAVPDTIRAQVTLPVNMTYNISIPNDDLAVDLSKRSIW